MNPTPSATPLKFRKKPVVIEAMQNLIGHAETIGRWMKSHGAAYEWDGKTFTIPTLEGRMFAGRGDWIIRGVKGEFYPCKPDIFAATYEPATPLAVGQVEARDLLETACCPVTNHGRCRSE